MKPAWALLLVCALGGAHATTFRVDDSGTAVAEPVVQMRWRNFVPGRAGDHTVEAVTPVYLRLNLANWVGKQGRLYMALGQTQGEQVRAQWQTQGRLMAGSVLSGGRALVYEGPITQPVLTETIQLSLQADGRNLAQPRGLQFHFEIDVLP